MKTCKQVAINVIVVIAFATVAFSIAQIVGFVNIETPVRSSQISENESDESERKSRNQKAQASLTDFTLPSLVYSINSCPYYRPFEKGLVVSIADEDCFLYSGIFVRGCEKYSKLLKILKSHWPIHELDQEWKLLGKSEISYSEKSFLSDAFSSFMDHYEHEEIFKDEHLSSGSGSGIFNEEFTEDEYRELFYPYMTLGNKLMRIEFEHHMSDLKNTQ